MEATGIITVIYSILSVIFNIYLFSYMKEYQNDEQKDRKNFVYDKKVKIYLIIMFLFVLLLSIILSIVYKKNTWIHNVKLISIVNILWPIAYIDFQYMKIPNKLLMAGGVLRILLLLPEIFVYRDKLIKIVISEIIAAVLIFVICILINLIMKNAIGMGDIKMLIIMSLFIGEGGIIPAVICSLLVSFFVAIFFLVTGKKGKKDMIPFAPSLLIGTYLSVFLLGV